MDKPPVISTKVAMALVSELLTFAMIDGIAGQNQFLQEVIIVE